LGKEEGRKKGAEVIADFTGHLAVTMAMARLPASSNQGSALALSAWALGGGRGEW
jgi:hypothetical protein